MSEATRSDEDAPAGALLRELAGAQGWPAALPVAAEHFAEWVATARLTLPAATRDAA